MIFKTERLFFICFTTDSACFNNFYALNNSLRPGDLFNYKVNKILQINDFVFIL